ncbi:hypothetical protein [Pontibacter oryzae]|uniref:DUF4136 domain-containing protein n=1 Tax=Pontibacter oryzae TaxID=2304593 RepID=A0A399SMS8_9BACT|nr:hypothetical protein [Pontibacter oryzae]RIJ43125.1 hypothetical protein D1627_04680 [Pontibacter oryzae]
MHTIKNLSLKKQYHTFVLAVLAIAFLWGCAPATRITGTWKNPEANSKTYDKIVVAALTDNIRAREKVETDMQAQLRQHGIDASRSIDMFPPTVSKGGPDVNELLQKVKSENNGAILTVALLDEETETRYVPGSYGYTPMTRFGWYGRFRGYYTYWYPTLYDPGYYTEDKVYFLETNLYDASSENLLWSAQSKSYSPASLRKASETLAELTINRMAQDNLIR